MKGFKQCVGIYLLHPAQVPLTESPSAQPLRYMGTSLIGNTPPPQDHHRALGLVLLQGSRGWQFLMSEVPLYPAEPCTLNGNPHTHPPKPVSQNLATQNYHAVLPY